MEISLESSMTPKLQITIELKIAPMVPIHHKQVFFSNYNFIFLECVRNNVPFRSWNTTNSGTTCTVCNVSEELDGHLRGRFWMKTDDAVT